ncbi:MAG: UDP-3-O-[3-hydroxymyristoyl] N-acetylglucosamine deacetylase [Planctomycetaceae bacterium]|nr:UDP-3-O-[3-hydroxymyristoyl] N-acetylglucosamine deacetylase [Planctomycetaceae bacterium]
MAIGEEQCTLVMHPAVRKQNTIRREACLTGVSLFHGFESRVRLLPAGAGHGIVFRRVDVREKPEMPARCHYLAKEPRRTVLQSVTGVRVETVEHLMAALAGLQVDNCIVEIDAPEVPSFDGSSRAFCDAILEAGIEAQDADCPMHCVSEVLAVQSSDRRQSLVARPYIFRCLSVTYHLDYGRRAVLPPQSLSVEISPEYFYEHLAAARTFVLESEIKALRQMGFGKHLTTKDIVVVGENGILDNQLRWSDEGVRHKILDCVGDLALCGRQICGHITACRSGHHLNHELAGLFSSGVRNRDSANAQYAA